MSSDQWTLKTISSLEALSVKGTTRSSQEKGMKTGKHERKAKPSQTHKGKKVESESNS